MLNLIVFAIGCNPNVEKMKPEEVLLKYRIPDVGSYSLLIELDTQSTLAGKMSLIHFPFWIQVEKWLMIFDRNQFFGGISTSMDFKADH